MAAAPEPAQTLRALAAHLGINTSYTSAWGDEREVPDDSLKALLEACGLDPRTPEEQRRRVAQLEEQSWTRLLEPVTLLIEGEPQSVLVTVASGTHEATGLSWRVVTEDGNEIEGSADLSTAPVVARQSARARRRLTLHASSLPLGYHRLEVRAGAQVSSTQLIVVPRRAYLPPRWASGAREWAVTAQLYSFRSSENLGVGDFGDLAALTRAAAEHGASAIGLNPLHALFPAEPERVSPYSPSSRSFLNPLYLDLSAVPDLSECEAARALLASPDVQGLVSEARQSELVDYAAVWRVKERVLSVLHRWFQEHHLGPGTGGASTDRGRAFRRFQSESGERLHTFALFVALQAHFQARGIGVAWRAWPEGYRDPRSPEVAAFARAHASQVQFAEYIQWEADRQLEEAARAAVGAGMSIGLYRDIAVGVDPNGAEAWAYQELLVQDASIGAPPDIFNPNGQNWGLTPLAPAALKEQAYAPFVAAVRANMRHAGAVRLDHVLGLKRLWWVPRGQDPAAGAYVSYPLEDLLGIVALESQRHRCIVIGEDLGTVPEGFREQLQGRGILSYRLLMFERESGDGDFLPPSAYPELAAAAVSTHDLATVRGLWTGRDLELRQKLGLYPSKESAESDLQAREATRRMLVRALARAGALSGGAAGLLLEEGPRPSSEVQTRVLVAAAHLFLASTPCRLLLVQLEDLLEQIEQMNLPGTVDEHPNWRRKLRMPIEEIFRDPFVLKLTEWIADLRRGKSVVPPD